ncbi:hypothetical protein LSM04_008685 [Trypanosoma melophagium]|uniref:uncharacterized protein n=1 Tax=Trypanosoma melophagium TaxID=715481 RepID=UPI00351A756E|nr:hypothetical protein LSM04_008685 [Trypanosoma melophagium]
MIRRDGGVAPQGGSFSTNAEIHHVFPNPPPVPTTRGPPLTTGGRTPSGPPRGTPKRWSVRYSTGISCRSEGDPLHANEASANAGSLTQRYGKYTVKGAAPLVPSAADVANATPESGVLFWTVNSDVPTSVTTSLAFHVDKETTGTRDDASSIAFEVLESLAAPRVSAAPLVAREVQELAQPVQKDVEEKQKRVEEKQQEQREEKKPEREPEGQEGVINTGAGVSCNNSSMFSSYFNGNCDVANHDGNNIHNDDDDMESLPAALPPPPPTPHPTAASNFGKTATRLEFGGKHSTGNVGKDGEKVNGVQGGAVPKTTTTTTTTTTKPKTMTSKPTPPPTTTSTTTSASASVFRHVGLTPPPPVLQPPMRSILNEVNAWTEKMSHVEDMGFSKLYLQDSERAFRDIQRETEVLLAENAIAEKGLRAAKDRYVDTLDECDRLQKEKLESERIRSKNKNENQAIEENDKKRRQEEEEKYAEEIEAWRIEKGELLAQKALLLQKRSELQHHLRRGTNIKNVAAVSRPQRTSQERNDQIDGSIPPTEDLETIKMRLEVKESRVCFEKLVESHRNLKETRRLRQEEFEDESSTLRQTAAGAREEAETSRSALQASLNEAERLRAMYQKEGEDSLVLLLERGIGEARVVLKQSDSSSAYADSIRSRGASMTRRSSLNSTPRRGAGSFASSSTAVTRQSRLN